MSANLQPFSSAGGFVSAGDITAAAYASPAPSIRGFSSVNATTLVAGSGNINGGTATVVTDGINSIALALGAQMDVYGFPFSTAEIRGRLTISGDISTTQALGTWYYQSTSTNAYQLYTDSTYTELVDATGWTAYTGGGSVAITKQSPAANIILNSNGYLSIFDSTGNVLLPGNLSVIGGMMSLTGEGVIRSDNDTVSIQSYDVANGIGRGLRVGDTGGLYLEQGANSAWLSFNPNAGNATIYSGPGVSGGAGHSLSITAGDADQTSYYTTPGGNVNITGGLGASDDGGGGGPGGSVNLASGASSDVAGHNGNVTINTGGANTWTFDYTGNLTAPSSTNTLNLVTRNGDANPNYTKTQIAMGYAGTTDYSQFIHTKHNASSGAYNTIDFYTSDGTQAGTFPANAILGGSITQGTMQLAVYANTTVRDSVITAPQPGMMIYVTGTGMQVRGATSWNTIAGSNT